jgi:hypothetical protein
MTQTEARRYVASQTGVDHVQLSSLLDTVQPATLAHWTYITGQTGHTSAQELRRYCLESGAFTGEQA